MNVCVVSGYNEGGNWLTADAYVWQPSGYVLARCTRAGQVKPVATFDARHAALREAAADEAQAWIAAHS